MHGVNIYCGANVTNINGEHSVESVRCVDGSVFPAQLVIIGVGVVPEIQLAKDAGLVINNGIEVDEYGLTSDKNIFAAGDCCSHPAHLYQRRLRLESVQNANDQSRAVAVNMTALTEKYQAVPWFWSDQFDIKLQSVGLSQDFDRTEMEGSLNPADRSGFVVRYFKEGKIIAADCVNRPKDFMAIKTELANQLLQADRLSG
jgi:3-phenylpropionate/trans-cinnamate dioxygenase ferredoxin reductase subunit